MSGLPRRTVSEQEAEVHRLENFAAAEKLKPTLDREALYFQVGRPLTIARAELAEMIQPEAAVEVVPGSVTKYGGMSRFDKRITTDAFKLERRGLKQVS